MGKIPNELRETIGRNIRECRMRKYPGRGGGKKCADSFGVSPQQWSPWERAVRTPDELRLSQIAEFFGVTVEFMRRDNRVKPQDQSNQSEPPPDHPEGGSYFVPPHAAYPCGNGRSDGEKVYVPVFVVLPHLPDDMQSLYEHFSVTLNRKQNGGRPPA